MYTLISFSAAVAIVPLVIALCKKQGWYDTINVRKIHSGSIPRLGSIGFVPVFLIASSIYLKNLEGEALIEYLPLVGAGTLVFILGIIDDFYDLSAVVKLIGQCIASIVPIIFGFQIECVGPLNLSILSPVITFFWFLGIINAFNLIDGVDALCGSLSFSVLLVLGIVYTIGGSDYNILFFILGGGVAGFLVYNKPKAKIFMGDGGAQFLGFIIAVAPLFKPKPDAIAYNLFPMTLVVASIPMMDTIAAMWRRKREGRSFFSPDKMHLHHKLMNMGYTTKSILFFLLIIQAGICGISLAAVVWIEGLRGFVVLCGVFAAMIVFFTIIHYTSHSVARMKAKDQQQT
ncbi:MAG: undecaprenyl/decaprenyl-phosphate alpha-N-acetylglucosaminyl 1-phosphate transferase [Treponema sp.]|jgi:UDP-GlcNAc:undecaprenyl-phosphate GlcNAc-1-phosphate transferase|nr:undecaprenyl/decaprenyl-phosphate alpha-N-acetylglucosaminyl 1-phosphate transferase [Treponema sp.]